MSSISAVRFPAVAVRATAGASSTRRAAALRAPCALSSKATFAFAVSSKRHAPVAQKRGALVVRNDAIDEAAELAVSGKKGMVNPDLAASSVVPKLPRSTSTKMVKPEEGFNLATTSFGTIGLSVGLPLLSYGFFSFFNFLPGGSVSSLLLIYGFIISLIGFALKYAQLDPLECVTYEDALALRETQTTGILTQVRNDVTRYRYGDEQHLEEASQIIFRYNRPGGLRKSQAPTMTGLAEMVIVDRYALVLKFDSPKMTFEEWTDRREKIQGFFGPGVTCGITEVGEGKVEVELVSDGSDASGPTGNDDMEVLPPLMPGLPPRYVKKGRA
jgi:hypothetical protein|tara:strand:+ start:16379 stop:17365 length:987 start_codon:yes stop_codon:yes gene_type:complete